MVGATGAEGAETTKIEGEEEDGATAGEGAQGADAETSSTGAAKNRAIDELVVDIAVAELSANPQSFVPAVIKASAAGSTPDQCTIKVTWKKNTPDEPSSKEAIISIFSDFGRVKKVGIKETSEAKKSKSALVVFESPESVRRAVEGYKGSWKVKAYAAASGDGGEQPGSTKSSSSTASTPKSTKSSSAKNSKVVDSMFERSIKVSWNVSVTKKPPTSTELKQVFSKYGTVSKLMPTDKEPYAVVLFQRAEEALNAARNYEGDFGVGVKVKLLKEGGTGSPGTQTVKVSPKKKNKIKKEEEGEASGLFKSPINSPQKGSDYDLAPLKTTPTGTYRQQKPLPSSDSSYDGAIMAAQKMLHMGSSSANSSPMADSYNAVELKARDQRTALIIEKLMSRNETNEAALARAMDQIQELTRELSGMNQREVMTSSAKNMEEQEWASENMSLKVQLKETEKSEAVARKELVEAKQEIQVMKAELHSVERTSRTIEIVQEKAYERAQRDVGAKLLMQENRLEAQGVEIASLTQSNTALLKENETLNVQNTEACTELVAWRVRAEAAELELKSLGKLATSEEEKKSLALARLLNSRVVGVDVGNLPVVIGGPSDGTDYVSPMKKVQENEMVGSEAKPVGRSPAAIEESRREVARQRIITSKDILEQAWSAQRALAERLDRDITMAGGILGKGGGLNMSQIKIEEMTGQRLTKAW
eukprot:CAMPEP_0118638194 /NCGR_PEP_ID=MMETSP0785-20121206/3548_1 /TAXON_ID=91992 /ORGANISM="Bolidomonas pacifica, Strain CCMP 1866" /LENGTH=705 /DNA_ID=CAMNT_0006529415 /DNA_START=29 /DNA_END=2143 /DNA_ORIENTATION=+